jgi:hypothetical protein
MTIQLGKTEVNMIDPPTSGELIDGHDVWNIGHNSSGDIVLRHSIHKGVVHPEFTGGMHLIDFCWWVNSKL